MNTQERLIDWVQVNLAVREDRAIQIVGLFLDELTAADLATLLTERWQEQGGKLNVRYEPEED